MTPVEKIEKLSRQITPERYAKMLRALEYRTRRLTVVLEDIYQPHNAAAVLRSCDAFGLQSAYVIENRYPMKISHNVDMGVSKWMDIFKYKSPTCTTAFAARNREPNEFDKANTIKAISELKAKGYVVAASSLDANPVDVCELPVEKPLAIMIGTELTGLSKAAFENADITFKTDMLGFAQSFNLSVFAALCISQLSKKMRALNDDWKMGETEKRDLLLHWLSL